jgi:hypothetical protein
MVIDMDRIFNTYKIRYNVLTPQMLSIRASRKIHTINIYINVDDFFHKLHRPDTDREFQTTGKSASKQFVSNLINLAAHYKHWAIKEHLSPNIYLVYTTSKVFRNSMTLKGYRDYYEKITDINNPNFFYVNTVMSDSFSILQIVAKYIPRVYGIDSNYIEPSVIPLYLSKEKPADFNLLISRDNYDLQYTHLDKWGVIIPTGEVSPLIVSGNLWNHIQVKEKITEKEFYYHPETFIWAKSIIGDKYRSIPKLTRTSWKTVIKYLKDFSSMHNNSVEILELQLRKLADYITQKKIEDTDFNHNLYCTSVKQQLDSLMEVDKIMISQQLTDMEDMQSLYHANNTIFKEYPLNLLFLLQENPPMNSQPNDDYFWRKRKGGY